MYPGSMRFPPKSTKSFIVLLLVTLLSAAGLESISLAAMPNGAAPAPSRVWDTRLSHERADRDLSRIIGILESRIKNHQLPEKAKNKLATMDDKEIRLVASLCGRITGKGDTAGADLALMLVTALIVLS
jgi:hypothetical protein